MDLTQKSPSCGRNRPVLCAVDFLRACVRVHVFIRYTSQQNPSPSPQGPRREGSAGSRQERRCDFYPPAQREEGCRGPMRSLRVALLSGPHPRLSASLFSPPVPPLRGRLPAGEVKEKPTDLRKTNLAVYPTSKPPAVFEQSRWRAAGARSGESGFQFLTDAPSRLPAPREGREAGRDGRCCLQEAAGMGGRWGGRPFIPFPATSVSKSK